MLARPITTRHSIPRWLALLPLALMLLLPGAASAADSYEAAWNGGQITATANADFTEATIESISVSFDECGTATGETSCTWEARFNLHSDPASRCNTATPEEEVVWSSGTQSGNGTVTDAAKSFPLEGCRGQSLSMVQEFHKTYDETAGPLRPRLRLRLGDDRRSALRLRLRADGMREGLQAGAKALLQRPCSQRLRLPPAGGRRALLAQGPAGEAPGMATAGDQAGAPERQPALSSSASRSQALAVKAMIVSVGLRWPLEVKLAASVTSRLGTSQARL